MVRQGKKIIYLVGIFLLYSSCASFRNTIFHISIDDLHGDYLIQNEPYVKAFLEGVRDKYENYTILAFARTGLSFQLRRSRLLTHSFFVVVNNKTLEFNTLSFYGTDIARHSRGAWVLNADADLSSYKMYLANNNRWDVGGILVCKIIDVRKTAKNIINHIKSDITFFYINHLRPRKNMDNCNTALHGVVAARPR